MTTSQDIDRDRANAVYDADLHHVALLADEPQGANPWPGIAAIIGAVALAILIIVAVTGCSAPSAQQEAEDVAADARTAQMQAAIDARCNSRAAHEQLACAVDALAELQPNRWTPEDVQHGHQAAQLIGGAQ